MAHIPISKPCISISFVRESYFPRGHRERYKIEAIIPLTNDITITPNDYDIYGKISDDCSQHLAKLVHSGMSEHDNDDDINARLNTLWKDIQDIMILSQEIIGDDE